MDNTNTYEEKFQRFSNIISTKTMEGFMVADRNDKSLVAVLVKQGEKVNHLLHFLISMVSCGFWLFVWGWLALIKNKEQRIRISIDSAGNLTEEKIKI
ncbi:MAG: hypothetical protein ACK567_13330 [Chitinophagales bacterium]|jgi:hypothetical protein|nr:hypothetical protein [Sphingobacteriales bacterium]